MIYTCTFNPSIDQLLDLDTCMYGELNRTNSETYSIGGKGINVSRMLNNLDEKSTVLGFKAGFTGDFITESLGQLGIKNQLLAVDGITRINTKLNVSGHETEINSSGPVVKLKDVSRLLEQINGIDPEDYFVLAGNPNCEDNLLAYQRVGEACVTKGVCLIVDTNRDLLKAMLAYKPYLIKPNIMELNELLGKDFQTMEEVLAERDLVASLNATYKLVSFGKDGALLFAPEAIYVASAPKGELINSVGSGDSMLAGFIYAKSKKYDDLEALRFSVACGSGSAFSKELATLPTIHELLNEIKVEK